MRRRTDLDGYHFLRHMQVYHPPVSAIASIGVCLPKRVVDNEEVSRMVNASPSLKRRLPRLIQRVTGIKTRRYAEAGTSPSDLAVEAVKQAIHRARADLSAVDTLIFAGTDMDMLEPATANIVQHKLGIRLVNSFDVTNACNSFLQAMNMANSLIATGAAERVLICSGEVGSYACNLTVDSLEDLDIKMGGLTLGDAGAAMLLERSNGKSGLTEINLKNMGEYWDLCHIPETTDWRRRKDGVIHGWFYLKMSSLAEVAREVTKKYFDEYKRYRKEACHERDWFDALHHVVPHQISKRFVEVVAKSVSAECVNRMVITADIYGNTASTAIPLALNLLMEQGKTRLGSGHDILLYGAASGFGIGHLRVTM